MSTKLRKTVILLTLFLLLAVIDKASAKEIWVLKVEGVINPVAASYIDVNIEKAQENPVECIILRLDTPGGLMTSTRAIIKNILNSSIPVIVYVSPSGAQAASAGVFITVSAHLAAMAPGTNIGAAHPVSLGGGFSKPDSADSETMKEKVTNDAVAYIRSLAHQRGRNEEWVAKAVRQSVSITETEALTKNVIDLTAKNMRDLLEQLEGKEVQTTTGETVLKTSDRALVHRSYGFHRKILDVVSDPNVAYILLIIGFWGIFFEIKNPGAIVPGVVGGISLLLAFFAFQILPINYAGLALIIVGIVLFILEVSVTSFGLLTIGGIVCMILGSMMLIDVTEAPKELFSVSLKVIIPVVVFSALFFIFAFSMAYKAHRRKATTGSEGIIGLIGEAITNIDTEGGKILVHGEIWNARSEEPIKKGAEVKVSGMGRMQLIVKKADT